MAEDATPSAKLPTNAGLAHLRQPVDERYIAKLPKPTKQQTEAVKADVSNGIRCHLCGTWHHPKVVHLDYVGHAATTARLLEADENWNWEPLAWTPEGLPRFDAKGGLWIKLTVCGQTRLGYGQADEKNNADAGSREKEIIGDAIRNAAMRFGWALDLWHKGGDLFAPVVPESGAITHSDGDGGSEAAGEGGQAEAGASQEQQQPAKTSGRGAKEKPPYTLDIQKVWGAKLMAGRISPAAVIASITSRFSITPEQREQITKMEMTR